MTIEKAEARRASNNAARECIACSPDQPSGRPIPTDPEALLDDNEAAYLRFQSKRTLEKERLEGGGCPFVKIGRSVRYRRRDVLEYIEQRIRHSTSDPGTDRG